jgi:membrane protein implicated in regulation of membrane protease activity
MDFTPSTLWWLLAAVLVALELTTGTFYLLMLAVGAACGALAAHAGLGSAAQMATAAFAGLIATLGLRTYLKGRAPPHIDSQADRNVNLDVGERVMISKWNDDNTARAMYRGAEWLVRFAGEGTAEPGEHRIVALEGTRLIVKK